MILLGLPALPKDRLVPDVRDHREAPVDPTLSDDRQFLETRMGSAPVLGTVRRRW
jgi:hypothetical protein